MDSAHVVSGSELQRLRFRARLWVVGWVAAIGLGGFSMYCLGSRNTYNQAIVAVREVQAEQDGINASQVKSLTLLNKTAEAVSMWATVNQEPLRAIIEANRAEKAAEHKIGTR